jgi:hypothetical protein
VLTIFAIPKSFDGHTGVIQRNAVVSWRRLRPPCQVVLFGDDETRAAATELGVEHLPVTAVNEFGTPLVDAVFQSVEEAARFPLLCYVNADIVLLSEFTDAVARLAAARRRFLMVGERRDLDVTEPIEFDDPCWEQTLRRRALGEGAPNPDGGIDYFVYPRETIVPLPPFAVGRPGWDNWMVYHARRLRLHVVDASAVAVVVHQNHGHRHVPAATGPRWEGPEAASNLALLGSRDFLFSLADATHRLTTTALTPTWRTQRRLRRLHSEFILAPAVVRRASRPLRRRLFGRRLPSVYR